LGQNRALPALPNRVDHRAETCRSILAVGYPPVSVRSQAAGRARALCQEYALSATSAGVMAETMMGQGQGLSNYGLKDSLVHSGLSNYGLKDSLVHSALTSGYAGASFSGDQGVTATKTRARRFPSQR
jgi:hypothetical protein